MTMEDITLNLYVPSAEAKEKSANILKRPTSAKKIIELKTVKKKSINEEAVGAKSAFQRNTEVNHTNDLPLGKMKTLLKRSVESSKQSHVHEITKKKKRKTSEESSLNINKCKSKSSLFHQNTGIVDIGSNVDVKPIYEPLFSSQTFDSLGSLHPHLVANLEQLFSIKTMTVVQQITIPVLLSGKDALIRSQTGSGKTLCYAIPIANLLQNVRPKISRSDGVKALVVLPTRELALQTYECFQKLFRAFTWIVPGLLVGGEKRKSEKARLRKGITVLIGTPGRLLDHVNSTTALSFRNVQWFVVDEADKLLELGYEESVGRLLEVLKKETDENSVKNIQTILLSATLTPGVEKLAGLALNCPVRLSASNANDGEFDTGDDTPDDASSAFVIPHSLDQKYIIVPAKLRLVVLASAIIHHCQIEKTGKILIFMATQDMVNFYTDLLSFLPKINVSFFKLHGNMTQIERTEVFRKFRLATSGVLLCTDVGARGLDLPQTEVIIQYNSPSNPSDYVHRVGRTARVGSSGDSIIFLDSSELNFLHWLNEKRIKLTEHNMEKYLEALLKVGFDERQNQKSVGTIEEVASNLQLKFEQVLLDDKKLHEIACEAYKSWVRFYASYPKESRTVFCFKQLHLGHYAKSFALRDAPSKIGGLGKPSYISERNKSGREKKKKVQKLNVDTMSDWTKRLITSEFDSGINFKTKRK